MSTSAQAKDTIALDRAHNLSRIWDKCDGTDMLVTDMCLCHDSGTGLRYNIDD